MPVTVRDLPVKPLRELLEAYHDHKSPDRNHKRSRLILYVGEKNAAKTSLIAFERTVAAPAALCVLNLEHYEFFDILVVVAQPDKDDVSKILKLSQLYITSPKRFYIIEVRYQLDGPRTTCTTTVRRYRLRDIVDLPVMSIETDLISIAIRSTSSDDTKLAKDKQPRLIYQIANISCSTISTDDFKSAVSRFSREEWQSLVSGYSGITYHTAQSGRGSAPVSKAWSQNLEINTEYNQLLRKNGLWPVNPSIEQDWSGRGQHAEFQQSERQTINNILEVQDILGSTNTAVVESVRCRRILLARKTMSCGRGRAMNKQRAIKEVAHLSRLSHAHILRVIGTYVMGTQLSILLYPVADCNLQTFLEEMRAITTAACDKTVMFSSSKDFFGCLNHATKYIHSNLVKHMDIKP